MIWAIPQTPVGDALTGASIELGTLSAISATSIELTLSNTYPAGSVFGTDPCPSYTFELSDSAVATTHNSNGTAGPFSYSVLGSSDYTHTVVETDMDPDQLGFHVGRVFRVYPTGGAGVTQTARGSLGLFSIWPTNGYLAQSSEYMRSNFEDANRYWPTPHNQHSGHICMGPIGASFPAGTNYEGIFLDTQRNRPAAPSSYEAPGANDEYVYFGLLESVEVPAPAEHPVATTDPITGAALPDHCALALDRLLSQFRQKPNIEALLCILADQVTEIDQELMNIQAFRSISTAVGQQLDNLGSIMGLEREEFSDDDYRIHLQAAAMVKNSSGTMDELANIMLKLDNGFNVAALTIVEEGTATAVLNMKVDAPTPERAAEIGLRFFLLLDAARYAGVRLILEFSSDSYTLFSWAEDVPAGDPAPPINSAWAQDVSSGDTLPGGKWKDAL